MKTLQTLTEFAAEHRITIESQFAPSNPNMPGFYGDHWFITLKSPDSELSTHFSTGLGLRNNGTPISPSLECVLDCLVSDAAGFEANPCFEDWCSDYGYDSDSREAERIYKAVEASHAHLKQFIEDPDLFQHLLFNTERI